MRNDVKSTTWSSLELIYFSAILITDDLSSHLFLFSILIGDWWESRNTIRCYSFSIERKTKYWKWICMWIKCMSTPETVQVTKELFIIMIGYLQNKNRKDSPVVHEKKEKNWEKIQPRLIFLQKLRWILSDGFSIRIHLTISP